MRRPLVGVVLAAVALATGSSAAGAQAATLTLGGDTQFPSRTLVLSGLGPGPLSGGRVHVTENGQPMSINRVDLPSSGRRSDLGVVLVIDRSRSMSGVPSAAAVQAARSLAAKRLGNQPLGIVTFNASARVVLAPSTSPGAITYALNHLPPLATGTHILPALSLAIRQIAAAKVAAGAVILLSDGADLESRHLLTPKAVAAQAQAAHVQIFTVGIRDQSYTPASMRGLAQIGGGKFIEATSGTQLGDIFTGIQSELASSWLIHYRSMQPLGRRISVAVRIDGTPGVFGLSYVSPPLPQAAAGPATPPPSGPSQSFWDSTVALLLVVAIAAVLLCIPVWLLVRWLSGPGSVSERVSGFVPGGPSEEPTPGSSLADAAAARTRATFSESSWWPAFVEEVDIAMIDQPLETIIVRTAAGACLLAALVWLGLGSALAAVLPLLAAPFALRSYVRIRVRRQRSQFADLVPSHLEEVAVSIRAGLSLVEAMNVVTQGAEEPMHREFERALNDENLGRPLEETLRVIAARMTSESVKQLVVVAGMHKRTGSSVSEAIERVAEGARERADIQRELRTLTAQGRLARWMLTFLPPLILLIMDVISPSYVRPLLTTTGGLVALAIAAVMIVAGSLAMKRIVDIEV